ncbi:tetratricopeptide repeat protein, partial [Acidovorax sp.]|uniref:tetratricopeptide repeat protein n=1 Tax=Acidovorax sp. TaxID=1872122 RepID=UPI0025BA22FE
MTYKRQKIINILLFLLLLSLMLFSWKNAMRIGNQAQRNSMYGVAKIWYQVAAYTGDANAQNNLAGFYAEGLGGERSDALAAKWFEKAAAAGVSAAKFNLSNFYEEGRGVPQDIRKAVSLLEELAQQRDAVAAFNLGHIYATGRNDFPQDIQKAIYWYEISAAMGYASAQYNLGNIYAQGVAVSKDYALAGQWVVKAAQQN